MELSDLLNFFGWFWVFTKNAKLLEIASFYKNRKKKVKFLKFNIIRDFNNTFLITDFKKCG
jgi:hypothetical protein